MMRCAGCRSTPPWPIPGRLVIVDRLLLADACLEAGTTFDVIDLIATIFGYLEGAGSCTEAVPKRSAS